MRVIPFGYQTKDNGTRLTYNYRSGSTSEWQLAGICIQTTKESAFSANGSLFMFLGQ